MGGAGSIQRLDENLGALLSTFHLPAAKIVASGVFLPDGKYVLGYLGRKYVPYKWQLKLILFNDTSKSVFHRRIFGYYILSNLQNIKCPEYDRRLGGTAV